MLICALMIVRDEAELLPLNLQYHLDLGIDLIFVLNHCSADETDTVLQRFSSTGRIITFTNNNSAFDHEGLANKLLENAIVSCSPDWVFLLDADEFLVTRRPFRNFVTELQRTNVTYGTIKWINALPVPQLKRNSIRNPLFFEPWAERSWQHEGHFRKAFARWSPGMRIVVGGHYFTRMPGGGSDMDLPSPVLIPLADARLCHFENRFTPTGLMRKWKNLANNLVEPNYAPDAPWNEKLTRTREYVRKYEGDLSRLADEWFKLPRTFWGDAIPVECIRTELALRSWVDAKGISEDVFE